MKWYVLGAAVSTGVLVKVETRVLEHKPDPTSTKDSSSAPTSMTYVGLLLFENDAEFWPSIK